MTIFTGELLDLSFARHFDLPESFPQFLNEGLVVRRVSNLRDIFNSPQLLGYVREKLLPAEFIRFMRAQSECSLPPSPEFDHESSASSQSVDISLALVVDVEPKVSTLGRPIGAPNKIWSIKVTVVERTSFPPGPDGDDQANIRMDLPLGPAACCLLSLLSLHPLHPNKH
jgi:hypothetical protein